MWCQLPFYSNTTPTTLPFHLPPSPPSSPSQECCCFLTTSSPTLVQSRPAKSSSDRRGYSWNALLSSQTLHLGEVSNDPD